MPPEKPSKLNSLLAEARKPALRAEDSSQEVSGEQRSATVSAATATKNLLVAHKGKLAIGAAAMLGLAAFYKWRESQLAKEDPHQYAQLRRIKSAVGNQVSKPEKENKTEQGDAK